MIRSRDVFVAALSAAIAITWLSAHPNAEGNKPSTTKISGWKPGVGWGWIWGPDDEIGALNALNENTTKAALQLAEKGV